jgi:hypothetical protein
MRKIRVLIITGSVIYLLCAYPLSAQVGLKAGINFSTLSQKGADLVSFSWGSAAGFTLGVFYTVNINEYLAFQPELYYSKKGGQLEGGILGVLASKSIAIHYLELPLLLKLKFPTQSRINPHLFVGPYLSFKLSDKGEIKVLGIELEEELVKIKGSDFGLVFGGGIDFKVKNAIVILDIRYDLGLVNIAEPILGIENEMKNRSLILMVGCGF